MKIFSQQTPSLIQLNANYLFPPLVLLQKAPAYIADTPPTAKPS